MKLRPEQERLIKQVCADLEARVADPSLQKEVVLNGAPASGKTIMSIAIASRLLAKKTFHRVLVLAHGTEIIRDNYVKELREVGKHVGIKADMWGVYRGSGDAFEGQIVVSLPQALIRVEDLPTFDLVIPDEAHHFYFAPMVQSIVERVGAKAVLALTGTPSPFVRAGTKTIRTLSLLELYEAGRIADPVIYLAESDFDFKSADYNGSQGSQELRNNATSPKTASGKAKLKKQVTNTFDRMLIDLARATAAAEGFFLNEKSERKDWESLIRANQKIMLVAHSQSMALEAQSYFSSKGIRVLLSISDIEGSTDEIMKFRNDPDERLLIVVNRGALGFDCPSMMTLIDMTGTLNIDRIYQMIGRTVRLTPGGSRSHNKRYIKVVSPAMREVTDVWVHAALMLADKEIVEKWNGKDLSSMGTLVAPKSTSHDVEKRQLLELYKTIRKVAPQSHPLYDIQQELFAADEEFKEQMRRILTRDLPSPRGGKKTKHRKTAGIIHRQPDPGFFFFVDHLIPRVKLGNLNDGKSVKIYAKLSLTRHLDKFKSKPLTPEEMLDVYGPLYAAEAERLGGPKNVDPYTNPLGVWFAKYKKDLENAERLPASPNV